MNEDKEKILSVSVAAYNVGDYLKGALQSCLSAHADRLEVIVVNDGSTDNTLEIARDYQLRYPGVFKVIDKRNGGYGSTLNAALDIATGKYFRYLDGDDWFDMELLEGYLSILDKRDEDAVYTPYSRVYEGDGHLELRDGLCDFDEGSYGMRDLQEAPHLAACSLAYRTDLLRGMGFRMTERCFYTDVEYAVLPFIRVTTVYVSKLPIYRYRIGREGQSVSLEGIERHYGDILRVCVRLLREIRDEDLRASDYLQRCLVSECATAYRFLTRIPPAGSRRAALKEFDGILKGRKAVYRAVCGRSKRAQLLRATLFLAYTPLCLVSAGRDN